MKYNILFSGEYIPKKLLNFRIPYSLLWLKVKTFNSCFLTGYHIILHSEQTFATLQNISPILIDGALPPPPKTKNKKDTTRRNERVFFF